MHSNADGRAMGMKDVLRAAVERSTGLRVMRQPPFGLDKYADIKLVLAGHPMRTLIDIGANVGQTARELRKAWPDAEIHCCEPVPTTFNALKAAVGGDARTHCHPVAIGARHETLEMHLAQGGDRSDISSLHAGHPALDGARITHIPVQVIPLTELFEQQGITHADLLKIDTEGHDLAVLDGAAPLLASGRIGLVDVEVGMNRDNTFHVPLGLMQQRLEDLGYRLFGIYDQMQEWPTKRPVLRRCNAVFIPERMAPPGSWSPFPQ